MIDWLAGWLAWLIYYGWLAGWLTDWVAGWLACVTDIFCSEFTVIILCFVVEMWCGLCLCIRCSYVWRGRFGARQQCCYTVECQLSASDTRVLWDVLCSHYYTCQVITQQSTGDDDDDDDDDDDNKMIICLTDCRAVCQSSYAAIVSSSVLSLCRSFCRS